MITIRIMKNSGSLFSQNKILLDKLDEHVIALAQKYEKKESFAKK